MHAAALPHHLMPVGLLGQPAEERHHVDERGGLFERGWQQRLWDAATHTRKRAPAASVAAVGALKIVSAQAYMKLIAEGHEVVSNVQTVADKDHCQERHALDLVRVVHRHHGTEEVQHIARRVEQLHGPVARRKMKSIVRNEHVHAG